MTFFARIFAAPLVVIACIALAGLAVGPVAGAAGAILEVCPANPIGPRPADFEPGGLILTTFDRASLWVLDVARGSRYPIPGSRPCGPNCHLSPDGAWFAYPVPPPPAPTSGPDSLRIPRPLFMKMRLDGTGETPLARDASDVLWWSADTLLVWQGGRAYLQPDAPLTDEAAPPERTLLDARGVISIAPGSDWALVSNYADEADGEPAFTRALVNLGVRAINPAAASAVDLGADLPFFNSAAWSPDGRWLAYVAPVAHDDALAAEVFTIQPGEAAPTQRTRFAEDGAPARIGGQTEAGGLSWSPDGQQVAFWAMSLGAPDPVADAGEAVLHVLDVAGGELRRYCGYVTPDHLPNPPRLVWSPDSTHVAFGGDLPDDTRGVILLALDVQSGAFVELSSGLYPALGSADVIAWGRRP